MFYSTKIPFLFYLKTPISMLCCLLYTSIYRTGSSGSPVKDLQHLNIMITAGPTREPLDPVRYISNHSSGKMGFAIAAAAAKRGANVTLVSGPVSLPTPPFVQRVDVMTALEMEAAVQSAVQQQHIFIGCAAVADYRAETVAHEKIKKQATQGDELTVKMVKNPDIDVYKRQT